jgi:hypothetical protein
MSNKPGRNDPCACGSGKKYKRCCLPTDEAAARERSQPALFDDEAFGDSEGDTDDEDDGFVDIEEDVSIVDVRALTRVSYTRGFVTKVSELRSGHGVRVTEWEAPQIPQSVLDSIEREALDTLEGEWGHPKVGNPIQVDLIDLETDSDIVSVEVFNRAIALVHGDGEEVRRIHRVCGVLEAASSDGSDPSAERGAEATAVPPIQREEISRLSAEVDMSAVLKEHRRQGGTCELCGETLTRASAQKHLAACAPAHDVPNGASQRLVQVRAMAPGLPAYWLDLELKADAKLEALDRFLRQLWLECCGHLSVFRIGAVNYFSRGYDLGFTRAFGTLGGQPAERSMGAKTGDALPRSGEPVEYEYDFGSTTMLQLRVMTERIGRIGRPSVRLLARNTPPVWPCGICGQPATWVCTYCLQEEDAFACTTHRGRHACGEQEGFLPVVNSPRMGVCGYTAHT